MVPRFLVYSHDDTQLFELDPEQVVSASSTEEVNGEHSLTIATMQLLEKEQRVLVQDSTLKWREYVVTGIDAEHNDGAPVHTYYCVWSLQHDLMATKVNKQPGIRNPVSARVALTSALDGTGRWTVGTVTRNTSGGVSMYYMSGWEALSKVVEVWGGEVDVTIGVSNSGVVSRRVDLYDKQGSAEAVRRFDYGSDIETIKRTVSDEPFVCRIIPRGKGEETEGGGYGRRITIASVNGGIEWLEDSEAVPLVRLPDGQGGWEYPTLIVVNENIDDPQALKDWALEHLHDYTRPKVTYSASVVQFAEAGMDTQGIELGDTVQCVDRTFAEDGLRITGRVVRLVTNELDRRDIEVEIGFLKGTIASQFQSLQSSVETVSAYLETLANDMSTPEWIDGLIDRINREVNATGGYTYIVEGNGIRTYDKAVTDPAVGAEADAVVEIKGGTIRIANSRDGQGNWEWKTVFTSGHIAGDLVTAAQITTGYIGSVGGTFIDLDNNVINLGDETRVHTRITDEYFHVMYDDNDLFALDVGEGSWLVEGGRYELGGAVKDGAAYSYPILPYPPVGEDDPNYVPATITLGRLPDLRTYPLTPIEFDDVGLQLATAAPLGGETTGLVSEYATDAPRLSAVIGTRTGDRGINSLSSGILNHVDGMNSAAFGYGLMVPWDNCVAVGSLNKYDEDSPDIFSVGTGIINGSPELSTRNTAFGVSYTDLVYVGGTTDAMFGFRTSNVPARTSAYIYAHDTGSAAGHNLVVKAGHNLVMGGGEYADARYDVGDLVNQENAYIGADGTVYIESNGNVIDERRTWAFNANGTIDCAGISEMDTTAAPQSPIVANPISMRDKNGVQVGQIRINHETDGRIGAALVARTGTDPNVKQNAIRAYIDASGNSTYMVTAPKAFRDALGLSESATTTTVSDILTVASGFTITSAYFRSFAGIAQVQVGFTTANALTANTQHTVATLKDGKRPPFGTAGGFTTGGAAFGNVDIISSGAIRIRPQVNISAGAGMTVFATFILA